MQNKPLSKAASALKSFSEETLKQTVQGTGAEVQRFTEDTINQLTGLDNSGGQTPKTVEDIAVQTENLDVTKNAQQRIDLRDQTRINTELQNIKKNPNVFHRQYVQSLFHPQDSTEQQRKTEELEAEDVIKQQKKEEEKRKFLSPLQMPRGIKRGLLGVKQAVQKGERKDNKRAAA